MEQGDIVKYQVDPAVDLIWRRFRRALRGCVDREVETIVLDHLSAVGGTGVLLHGTMREDGSCSIKYKLLPELALLEITDLARNTTMTAIARREKIRAALFCAGLAKKD